MLGRWSTSSDSVSSMTSRPGARPLSAQRARHQAGQVALVELDRGQVDADRQRRLAAFVPPGGLAAGLAQHPFADRHDHAGLLGQRDEVQRRDDAVLGVLPADQGLQAGDLLGAQVHDRLVPQLELVPHDGPAQVRLHLQPGLELVLHGRLEQLEAILAQLLRLVHGQVGADHQLLGVVPADLAEGDADAAADEGLLAGQIERLAQGLEDPAGHRYDLLDAADTGQQHGELVAAEPGRGVALAQAALDAGRRPPAAAGHRPRGRASR